jgi:hypothetical protein
MNAHTKQKVRTYLESGGIVTQADGMRIAQTTCIKDYCGFLIRKDHLPIKSEWRTAPSGKRFKAYFLEKVEKQLTFSEVGE